MIHLAATFGDPTSIGPEVGRAAIQSFLKRNKNVVIHVFAPSQFQWSHKRIRWHSAEKNLRKFTPGKPDKISGAQALVDLEASIDSCLGGECGALITGPLDKFWCAKNLKNFTGHTDYLKEKTGAANTTMLLEGAHLRVALATTHLPLSKVSKKLTKQKIVDTALRTHEYLKKLIKNPKIAVLGLNPHASDHGLFGSEEALIIQPAIRHLQRIGLQANGPYSADSFFHRSEDFDAVICMYHDQGLIPLKLLHFYDAINITLGLPFLRTSVDHGTAFDIAGKAKASSTSYGQALEHAFNWVKRTGGKTPWSS